MTEIEETIKSLEEMFQKGLCEVDEYKMAQVAINALEKQIQKKPKDRYKTRYVWDSAYCPICNCGITARWVYCQFCGQKLDWSDSD